MEAQLSRNLQLLQQELTRLKRKVTQSEGDWSRQRAILMQRIEMQQQQIQSLVEREQTQKQMYESVIASYRISEQTVRKEDYEFARRQIDQLIESNHSYAIAIREYEARLSQQATEKLQTEEQLGNHIAELRAQLKQAESQIVALKQLFRVSDSKSLILEGKKPDANQRMAGPDKENERKGQTEDSKHKRSMSSSQRQEAEFVSRSPSGLTQRAVDPESVANYTRTQPPSESIMNYLNSEPEQPHASRLEAGSIVRNDRTKIGPIAPMRSGVIMSVWEYNSTRHLRNK